MYCPMLEEAYRIDCHPRFITVNKDKASVVYRSCIASLSDKAANCLKIALYTFVFYYVLGLNKVVILYRSIILLLMGSVHPMLFKA